MLQKQTGHAVAVTALVGHVLDERAASVSEQFANSNPGDLQNEINAHEMVQRWQPGFLAEGTSSIRMMTTMTRRSRSSPGHWTTENLTETYKSLVADGMLDVAPGTARELTDLPRGSLN